MIQEIENRFDYLVTNRYVYNLLGMTNKKNVNLIEDSRSAAFYCLGLSQKETKKVVMLIDDTGLSSCYTAIVEAFFQKIPLNIIVLGSGSIPLFYSKYVEICNQYDQKILKTDKPRIFPIKFNIDLKTKIYSSILIDLLKKNKGCTFKVSNRIDIDQLPLGVLESEIGMIARYIGHTQVHPSVLVCLYDELLNEVNTLNLRYINKYFKIVALKNNCSIDLKAWLSENDIMVLEESSNFNRLASSDVPAVLIVNDDNCSFRKVK